MARPSVIIIGAGVAGLTAAWRLSEAGIDCTILEARNRIGGRIDSIQRSGLALERGAEFLHGREPTLWGYLRDNGILAADVPQRHLLFRRGHLTSADDFWEEMEPVLGAIDGEKPDEPFADLIRRRKPGSPRARELATAYIEGFNAADAKVIGTRGLAIDQAASDKISGDSLARPVGSYSALVDSLAINATRGQVMLQTAVTAIRWQRGRVDVTAKHRGRQVHLTARATIITVPISLLPAIHFDPPLPQKLDAANGLALGPVVKALAIFREPFWETTPLPTLHPSGKPEPKDNLVFIHSLDLEFPTWWTLAPLRTTALVGWAGGPAAAKLSLRPKREIESAAIRSLSQATGLSPRRLRSWLLEITVADWQSDPWSRGAYSYAPAGASPFRQTLAKPVDHTLFFAGEATHAKGLAATVHGAFVTGLRAAKEIQTSLL